LLQRSDATAFADSPGIFAMQQKVVAKTLQNPLHGLCMGLWRLLYRPSSRILEARAEVRRHVSLTLGVQN